MWGSRDQGQILSPAQRMRAARADNQSSRVTAQRPVDLHSSAAYRSQAGAHHQRTHVQSCQARPGPPQPSWSVQPDYRTSSADLRTRSGGLTDPEIEEIQIEVDWPQQPEQSLTGSAQRSVHFSEGTAESAVAHEVPEQAGASSDVFDQILQKALSNMPTAPSQRLFSEPTRHADSTGTCCNPTPLCSRLHNLYMQQTICPLYVPCYNPVCCQATNG